MHDEERVRDHDRDRDDDDRLLRAEHRREDRRRDERQAHGGRAFRQAGDPEPDDQGQELDRAQSASPTRDLQSTTCRRALSM